MIYLIEGLKGLKPANIFWTYYFIPGAKFFMPTVESFITLGKRWIKVYLDFVWGDEGDREAVEKDELSQGWCHRANIVMFEIWTTGIIDGLMEAGKETREHLFKTSPTASNCLHSHGRDNPSQSFPTCPTARIQTSMHVLVLLVREKAEDREES